MNHLSFIPTVPKLHHAYLVVGEPKKILVDLKIYLSERLGSDFISVNNPDFSVRESVSWGMDESRDLKQFSSHRPVSFPVKVLILAPETISFQAQNSLLKLLEEPSSDTHFFIVTKRLEEYLPTIISRCQVIKQESDLFDGKLQDSVKNWLKSDIAVRLEIIKEVLKEEENVSTFVSDWLNCLLSVYWPKVSGNDKLVAAVLVKAISQAGQRGSSHRVILEHLSLVVPRV